MKYMKTSEKFDFACGYCTKIPFIDLNRQIASSRRLDCYILYKL